MAVMTQLGQTFFLEEIEQTPIKLDSSQLVREVKKYPIIYDNNLRREQTTIFFAWENICTNMVPNFLSMSEDDKIATRKRLRDRWSYMRSTFRRDIFSNKMDSHKQLDWIREIKFLVPILTRPAARPVCSRNFRRRVLSKKSPKKANTSKQSNTSRTSARVPTTSTYIVKKPVREIHIEKEVHIPKEIHIARDVHISSKPVTVSDIINQPETESDIIKKPSVEADIIRSTTSVVFKTTAKSLPDTILSSDSSISDISTLDISSNTSTADISDADKSHNDLMVETFMSTFSLESFLAPPNDPDQMFLLTMLQNYRLVRDVHKESLQHKFYTFLRD